jgi:Zn-dependent peptidase ImmA (M78 family)
MLILYTALAIAIAGCVPAPEQGQAQSAAQVETIAKQIIPRVERAVGLKFRSPPAIAVRTAAQVQSYLTAKLDEDLPEEELEQITVAYRLFRLIPDSIDMRALLVALYSEQVVGYFDPDSATLYVVDRADPVQLKLVLAHELVHALQGQYVHLDSMLSIRKQNDRRNATQAVMEGQATLASIVAMMPEQDVTQMPDFWNQYRETVRQEQQRMPVFSKAPTIVREGLIFPYLAGADFARWFANQFRDTVPFGRRLPVSTEQILHPDRYLIGDRPVDLKFARGSKPVYEDNLGEFETRVLLSSLSGSESVGAAGALDWAGDRYGVFPVAGGSERALVWWTVWDTDAAARRFATLLSREWAKQPRAGRRYTVEQQDVATHPGVRLIDGPVSWAGWQSPPMVTTDETLPAGFTNPRALRRTPQPTPKP